MGYTAKEQRELLYEKRKKVNKELVKCLECDLEFVRVGSHVVQVHGYASVLEYRRAHGLMARETTIDSYKEKMRELAKNEDNLENGKDNRYKKGGPHGENVSRFWSNRREKNGTNG